MIWPCNQPPNFPLQWPARASQVSFMDGHGSIRIGHVGTTIDRSVAISQIWAEAILWDARRVWDLEAVESGAGLCHLLVGSVDGDAALTMGMSQSVALVLHVVAVPSGLPVH